MSFDPKGNVESVFHGINKYITLKENDKRVTAFHFDFVRQLVLTKMCEKDEMFKRLWNGHKLAGSTVDNIKISQPNEFDLLVYVKLPNIGTVQIERDDEYPGNIKINMTNALEAYQRNPNSQDYYKHFSRMVDGNKYLLTQKIQSWIEGILDTIRIIGTYSCPNTNRKLDLIKYGKSGPAHTIYIKTMPIGFSIDFVPAIMLNISTIQTTYMRRFRDISLDNTYWDAIPKSIKGVSVKENISWQASYAEIERKIISDKNNLKNTLRMLKKLRDTQGWTNFCSYYIKTIYLWECDKNADNCSFWNQLIPRLIFYMLERWIEYLKKGNLPFYWDERCNLLEKFSEGQIYTLHGQLNGVYKKMKNYEKIDPKELYTIFLTDDEMMKLKDDKVMTQLQDNQSSDSDSEIQTVADNQPSDSIFSMTNIFIGVAALAIGIQVASSNNWWPWNREKEQNLEEEQTRRPPNNVDAETEPSD